MYDEKSADEQCAKRVSRQVFIQNGLHNRGARGEVSKTGTSASTLVTGEDGGTVKVAR